MIGRTLSHFEIIRKLGAGGMGEVYLARDTKLERQVALKVLPAEMVDDPDRLQRLQREAKALAAIDHPNIVTIFSVEEAEGVHFLTMAHVEGRTLEETIPPNGFPPERLLPLAVSLADALRAAHERGIIHRDLKPANVMVDDEGRLRVLDFGLAKMQPRSAIPDVGEVATQTMTRQGTVLGTFPYMSPEQVEGKPVDARSDLFSLGVMLYEMATGRRPFRGETAASLITSIMRDAPEPVTEACVGLPTRLGEIIHRCLEKDPQHRFESAKQLREQLEDLQREVVSGQAVLSKPPTSVPATTGSPLRVPAVVGVLLIVAGLAAVAVWKLRGAPEPRIASLAVLPLQNLSGDPEQDYFVDGMTTALITDLSRIHALKVISPSSAMRYKGTEKSLREIAQELNVEAILEGSVLRENDRVAVTAQLIETANEETLWAQRYELEVTSVLALHGEVARTIAQAIEIQLTPDEEIGLTTGRQVNPETYEAYLRGMHHLSKGTSEGFATGIAFLNEAIDHDPADARAYAGLALGYVRIGHDTGPPDVVFPRAIGAANRALELDPNLADAHAAIADAKMYYEWDFDGARQSFEHAVQLSPNLAEAHAHYTWYHAIYGHWDEAEEEARRAQELDPLSPTFTAWLGCLLWYMEDNETAIEEARKSLDLSTDFPFGWYVLGSVYASQGRFDEAIEAHRKASEVAPPLTWALAGSYGRAGRLEEARQVLDAWNDPDNPSQALNMAMALGFMGETDEAIRWLEIAYETRNPWMPWIDVLPELRSLHGDPRFQQMLRRMNIPG